MRAEGREQMVQVAAGPKLSTGLNSNRYIVKAN